MGKKNTREDVPNPNSIVNRDVIQRLNFLYQSSVYLSSLPAPSPDPGRGTKSTKKRGRKFTTKDLSRSYVDTMKIVGKKAVVKMYSLLGLGHKERLDTD